MKRQIRHVVWLGCCLGLLCRGSELRADGGSLYGIHWWGYTQGQPVDTTPVSLLNASVQGGWDVETILTHSGASWWTAAYFQPLYADLFANKNVTLITRIDYNWGETVPAPTTMSAAAWATSVVGVVNTLRSSCHLWIIGNEPNLQGEGNGWPGNQVTPAGYANIYRTVRSAIHGSAGASPAGPHRVLIAPPSPGGIISGVRWMSGTDWLGQVLDNIPAAEVDGFAIHSYLGSVGEFRNGYVGQLNVMDAKGHADKPVYITEWNRYTTPGSASEEAISAQLCRDAFADVAAWNADPCHHNIVSMSWFVYDSNQQGGGQWDGYAIEYWKNAGNPAGQAGDLFTAFQQAVAQNYPAGAIGTPAVTGGAGMTHTMPAGSNAALFSSQVVTDSVNLPSQGGTKAIDGVVASGNKWTSAGTPPPHWLKLDLGLELVVSGYVVRHAGAGGESTSLNTQSFRIQAGPTFDGPWTDEAIVCNTAQENVTMRSYAAPRPLRYVRLFITDPGVDDFARIPEFEVYSSGSLTANFVGSPVAGKVPLTVQFTDQSVGDHDTWLWDFGDGGSSTVASPLHTYTQIGVYSVTLAVGGAAGSDSVTKDGYITVLPVGADFDGDTDVDQVDFAHLQRCLGGAGQEAGPDCITARLDNDLDVDGADLNTFVGCMSGADIAAALYCR